MKVEIYPMTLGLDHCYLIKGTDTILIDGGAPNQVDQFKQIIQRLPVEPEDIKLILPTHGHWDHIASTKDIQTITGARVALHGREKDWLEKGLTPMPPGVTLWGRILSWTVGIYARSVVIPTTQVDIVLKDNEWSLAEYGIPGKVIHTPGHSSGSVTILLEMGDAFVGDLAMNAFPLRLSPGLPIFAEDMESVKASWKKLFNLRVKTVYPAHGKPFSADIMRKALQ